MSVDLLSPAERAAEDAWAKLESALVTQKSFVFEAGAGAGKTTSLIRALRFIVERRGRELSRARRQVACTTYTNVARDQIIAQTDGHPAVYCDTTHAFAWSLIKGFQLQLREKVKTLPAWQERLAEFGSIDNLQVEYALGRRGFDDGKLLLHHDDIFPITIELLKSPKFRAFVVSKHPIILVDEYQDTDAMLVSAIKDQFLSNKSSPQLGFFGDHWQKIYGDGCGSIDSSLERISKGANFRSVKVIVDALNRLRPQLPQLVRDPAIPGTIQVFHTNGWSGKRRTQNHWQGDLPAPSARDAFVRVRSILEAQNWDFSPNQTKVLMLTHRALASESGYESLPSVFQYNDSFAKKAAPHIAFFADHLEPASEAFNAKRYGEMFEVLGRRAPRIQSAQDKTAWSHTMTRLSEIRSAGTVGDVVEHLITSGRPSLPDDVLRLEQQLAASKNQPSDEDRRLVELQKLRAVPYSEVTRLVHYLRGHSPFETKHGVKGAQFENVFAVFGRGWNEYNFNQFLEMLANPGSIGSRQEAYERWRNLFYVVCSRPKTRLCLLFTHQLSEVSLSSLVHVFGSHSIRDIGATLT